MDEKKNKYSKKKALMIAIIVALPTTMLFGFLLANTRAYGNDEYVPEDSIYNNWHWEVNEGDLLNYSLDMKVFSFETQEIVSRFKMTYIIYIEDIANISNYNLMGLQESVSQVAGISQFYNVTTGNLQSYGDSYTLGTFVYNHTDIPHLRYMYGQGWIMPMMLPVNDSNFDEDVMGDVLNDTYYYASLREEMNYFDFLDTSTDNNIYFEDTVMVGCYLNMTYRNDGILEKGDAKHLYNFGEDDWMILEYTIQNVGADINVTDEIEWGVDVGDILYMGRSTYYGEDEKSFVEAKIVIEKFNLSNYGIPTVFGEEPIPTTFENVIVDLYLWNWTTEEYKLEMNDMPLGAANNDYPSPYFGEDALEITMGMIPNNTILDDLIFMGEVYKPLDVEYSANNEWEFKIWSSEEDFSLYQDFDNKTGVLELRYLRMEGDLKDVMYLKGAENISNPVKLEPLYDDLVDAEVYLNTIISDSGIVELYSAVLPVNPLEPIGVKFNEEIPDFTIYIEAYTNESTSILQPNFTVIYDPMILNELEIPEDKLIVYYFNNDSLEYEPLIPVLNYTIYDAIDTIMINVTKLGIFAIGIGEVWNWSEDIKIGEKLIYESTGTLIGNVSELGIVTLPYIDFTIFNITAVGLGFHDTIMYNQINGTILYYNPEIQALTMWPDPGIFTISEYNYSAGDFNFTVSQYSLGFPSVIPLRWEKLALQTVGLELNKSFYSSSIAREIGFPIWDEVYANYVDRTLVFNDTVTNYYMKLKYYDNGTLEKAEISTKFNIEETPVDFNLTTTRMFDYNHTDEVEWGVEVGDSYYFGSNFPSGGPTIEINATIVAINQSAVYLHELFFEEDGGPEGFPLFQTILTFENVYAKIEEWNITSGEGMQTGEWIPSDTIIIGAANNYYSIMMGDYNGYHGIESDTIAMILPKGIDGYTLANEYSDFLGFMSLEMFDGEIVPEIEDVREDYLKINFNAPYEPEYGFFIEMYLNNETGILRYFYMYQEYGLESNIACMFAKNHSMGSGVGNNYKFNNYLVPDISGNLTVDTLGNYDLFEAILNKNPVNNSIPSSWGTPMFYLDFFYINNSNVPWNMTISLKFPSKYNVAYVTTIANYIVDYEERDAGVWVAEPIDDIPFGYITRDYQNNILTIHMINVNGTISVMEAWFYSPPGYIPPSGGDDDDDDGGEERPGIPGFDLWVILGIIAMVSLISILKRKELIDLI